MMRCVQRNVILLIALVGLMPLSLSADHTDGQSDADSIKQGLFKALAEAENEQSARIAEGDIWKYWFNQSPTLEVRAELDAGMARREAYDYEAAEHHLDRVIELAPDYAEGYNQRAFVRFLREDYSAAQADLDIVLKMEPNHFGALSGLFHILQIQDRHKAAMGLLRQAVEIHPWINERFALPREMWPDRYRQLHDPRQGI